MQAVAQLRAIITETQCVLQKDVKYPLCMYFSLLLILNRKRLLKKCFQSLFSKSNQWTMSGGKEIKKCLCKYKQCQSWVTVNLYTVRTNLSQVCIPRFALHYFWKLGGVPPLSDISGFLLHSVQSFPISWVVLLGLSAVPRLWPKHGYV